MGNLQRWWWIRHAPPFKAEGLCYGPNISADLSHPTRFIELATLLPRQAVWLSSPLQRVFETASKVRDLKNPAIALHAEPALAEQSFGQWEGKRHVDLHPTPEFQAYMADPVNVRPPDGESMQDMYDRIAPRINKLAEIFKTVNDLVIFAHGGSIRSALALANGGDIKVSLKTSIKPLNGICIKLDLKEGWLPNFDRF